MNVEKIDVKFSDVNVKPNNINVSVGMPEQRVDAVKCHRRAAVD